MVRALAPSNHQPVWLAGGLRQVSGAGDGDPSQHTTSWCRTAPLPSDLHRAPVRALERMGDPWWLASEVRKIAAFTYGEISLPMIWYLSSRSIPSESCAMSRPYRSKGIEELEQLVEAHHHERLLLLDILEELKHRKVPRARQLQRLIRGMLDGVVPREADPAPEDGEENQLNLLDE